MKTGIQSIRETALFQQNNPYVLRGYRVEFSKIHCVKSVFMVTNETINIWSHLLGALWFLYQTANVNFNILPSFQMTTTMDHVIMTIFCVSYFACMLLSVLYHIFNCHSEYCYELWLRNDQTGITIGILGCYIPSLYYGFYCTHVQRTFYMVSVMCLIAFLITYRILFYRKLAHRDTIMLFFYILVALFGIIPSIHFIALNGFSSHDVINFLPKIVVLYSTIAVGFLFYLSKFPERLLPGFFDYFGSSHQIWHLFVLFSLLWWFFSTLELLDSRLGQPNRCSFNKDVSI